MHSFHHSRGRVLFETACALTISASCVGAWMDLGVPAFLPAAAVAALYGLVHLFDMRRPAVAYAAPVVAMDDEPQGNLLAYVSPELEPVAEEQMAEADPVDEPPPAPEPKPKKRRASKKTAPVAEVEPVAEAEPVVEIPPIEAPEPAMEIEPIVEVEPIVEPEPAAQADSIEPEAYEEPEEHAPVTPLFEPEPFVRQQQRAVFGRKAS